MDLKSCASMVDELRLGKYSYFGCTTFSVVHVTGKLYNYLESNIKEQHALTIFLELGLDYDNCYDSCL